MHHHYAETQSESPGAAAAAADDDVREPTMTFDLSEVSTAYEPAYEPVDYESPQLSLSPLAKKGPVASFQSSSSSHHQQHKRQQSAPIFSLPRLNSSRSPSLSPTRHAPSHHHQHANKRLSQQDMPLTGDGRAGIGRPQNAPTGRFANWFNSPSAATSTVDERGSPNTTPKSTRGGGVGGGGGPTTPNEVIMATTPKSAGQSRFGLFASSVFGTRPANNQTPANAQQQLDDELCDLDIEAALYPGVSSSSSLPSPAADRDTFSPAAYKNLQTNAAGLLLKMQGAYRERTVALREARAERDADREEMEETKLRVALVKTQLEDMAHKAAEHEAAMQRLVTELNAEKRARYEERMAFREAAIAREKEGSGSLSIINSPPPSIGGGGGSPSEDLGVDDDEERRRRWRNSRGTVKSDLSVETMTTDGGDSAASTSAPESESVSVFSRSRSPTVMTSITTAESTVGGGESPAPSVILPPPSSSPSSHQKASAISALALAPPKPKQVQQLSTFQKFVKGISGAEQQQQQTGSNNNSGPDSCRNCSGQASSVAWDTVSLLRDENKGLKHRVAQLEVAVEGALDAVNGIGL